VPLKGRIAGTLEPCSRARWLAPVETDGIVSADSTISRHLKELVMSDFPPEFIAARRRIAAQYVRGSGLEIGALHSPLEVTGATVKHVDRLPLDGLRRHYPELVSHDFVPIDIVDDGETLSKISDDSQDFIIANHMLEHTENPLGTLRTHIAKIHKSGILYYAIPDKRHSFDRNRPLTEFDHLIHDDTDAGASSRYSHFFEWATLVNNSSDPHEYVRQSISVNYSIHFHVWDANSWLAFLVSARTYLGHKFDILHFECNGPEVISILKAE
jgi:hypothetical protein